MSDDLITRDELRILAEQATPGPWFAGPLQPDDPDTGAPGDVSIGPLDLEERYGARDDYSPERFNDHYEDAICHVHGCNHDAEANAQFIAAANPMVVKALLDLIDVLTETRDALTKGSAQAMSAHMKQFTRAEALQKRLSEYEKADALYTPEQQRVANYIVEISGGTLGGGEDPVGALMAMHGYLAHQIKEALAK